ncbi:acid protease [Mycena olivaceomarginata]|nr:acid protease [Mycena olivaceomarginata]
MVQLSFTLLPAILLALRVAAGPVLVNENPITLDISRRFNFTGCSVVQSDLARINAFKNRSTVKNGLNARDVISETVVNRAVNYIATVGVGSPATSYDLLIGHGKSLSLSLRCISPGKNYVVTSTSTQTTDSVTVAYGSGSFSGTEYTDQVTLAPGLVIPNQSIGVASSSSGLDGIDGILGGPSPPTRIAIPTVMDNLVSQGTITNNLFGISFQPTTTDEDANGSIAFGGIDSTKFTGEIAYTPVTLDLARVTVLGHRPGDGTTSILASTAGIVDTGSTLIHLATDVLLTLARRVQQYQSATGGVFDAATGLLTITATQYAALQNLNFIIGASGPRSLNTAIGGSANNIYLVVIDSGSPSGQGLDFHQRLRVPRAVLLGPRHGQQPFWACHDPFTDATTN